MTIDETDQLTTGIPGGAKYSDAMPHRNGFLG